MTLAYASPPRPRLRLVNCPEAAARRSRQGRERRGIPAGHPGALSWDVLRWEDDDHAWYAVAHHGPLDAAEVGALMGLDESAVRQIEEAALAKLRGLIPETFAGAAE